MYTYVDKYVYVYVDVHMYIHIKPPIKHHRVRHYSWLFGKPAHIHMGRSPIHGKSSHIWEDSPYLGRLPTTGKGSLVWEHLLTGKKPRQVSNVCKNFENTKKLTNHTKCPERKDVNEGLVLVWTSSFVGNSTNLQQLKNLG